MNMKHPESAPVGDEPSVEMLRAGLAHQEALRDRVARPERPKRLFLSREELESMSDVEIEAAVQEALDRPLDTGNNGAMSARSKFLRRVESVMEGRVARTRAALEDAGVSAAPPQAGPGEAQERESDPDLAA
jgi:hypothetical protein